MIKSQNYYIIYLINVIKQTVRWLSSQLPKSQRCSTGNTKPSNSVGNSDSSREFQRAASSRPGAPEFQNDCRSSLPDQQKISSHIQHQKPATMANTHAREVQNFDHSPYTNDIVRQNNDIVRQMELDTISSKSASNSPVTFSLRKKSVRFGNFDL